MTENGSGYTYRCEHCRRWYWHPAGVVEHGMNGSGCDHEGEEWLSAEVTATQYGLPWGWVADTTIGRLEEVFDDDLSS